MPFQDLSKLKTGALGKEKGQGQCTTQVVGVEERKKKLVAGEKGSVKSRVQDFDSTHC